MTTRSIKPRVAIYARYSSDLQNDRSIEDQIDVCEKFAAKNGWTVTGKFFDRAVSGASLFGRPQFSKMVDEALSGSFDIVLAEDLNRLSRNLKDIATLYEQMAFAEIEIHTFADGLINEMHIGLKGTMGALFLKGLAVNVRRGLNAVVKAGRNAGGDLYGYTPRKGEAGILDINPEAALVIKRIYTEYAGGSSPRLIAHGLNEDGVLSPRGGKWNASTINGNTARGQGLLLNEKFVGKVVWNKRKSVKDLSGRRITRTNPESEWIIIDVPALRILDDELFNAARARRLAAGTEHSRRRPKSNRLLSGLLRCGSCGSGMAMTGCDRSGPRVRCSRNRESGSCNNNSRYYIEKIEQLVLARLKAQIDNPKLLGTFIDAYLSERRSLSANARRDKIKIAAMIASNQRSIENLVLAIEKGTLTEDEASTRLQSCREQKRRLVAELDLADEQVASVDLHPTAVKRFKENLKQIAGAGDQIEPRLAAAFRELIESIVVMARKPGEPYEIEPRGRLAALIGGPSKLSAKQVVPVERIELPTFGLQNRCSTADLNRLTD